MCGIAGFIFPNATKSSLSQMTQTLIHRGPDFTGNYFDEKWNLGLGHTRLSIIDLSNEANQPYHSDCGRYVMVFNGEVYNYKEIKNKLNLNCHTNSDTEVILKAFIKLGVDFVSDLNGMFAIAIWDNKLGELYLFRDRLGIKPFYYYFDSNRFAFSSEIKSLKALNFPLAINKKAVYHYFNLGFLPQKETIFKEIKQLDAGSFGVFSKGELKIKKYWSPKTNAKEKKNFNFNYESSINHLDSLLNSSVEYRLISDVSLGTFLSGGTDSSVITAIASSLSSNKIDTFSIGFKEAKYNESKQAKKIAKYLKTNHNEFIVSYNDAIENIELVMGNFDQPFVDSSALPTYLISKLAKSKVSVALSGDGGDELFMGYGTYNWVRRLNNPLYWFNKKLISKSLLLSGSNRRKRASLVFNVPNKRHGIQHIFSQEQYLFSECEVNKLLLSSFNEEFVEKEYCGINSLNMSLFEIDNYLKEDLLRKVDSASMMNALEVRVPILDHRIVEFALGIPDNFKINGSIQKRILKDVLYKYVPKNMLDYPKWGFSIPLEKWLKKELKYMVDLYLDDQLIKDQKIFNPNYVSNLKLRYLNGEDYLYNRIWQLIVFNKFYMPTKAKW